MFNNNEYRSSGDRYNFEDQLSLANGDSTNHWSYDNDYERQIYEYPYVSYGYAYRRDGYNQGWVGSNLTYVLYSSNSYEDRGKHLEEPYEDHYLTIWVSKLEEVCIHCSLMCTKYMVNYTKFFTGCKAMPPRVYQVRKYWKFSNAEL